MMNKLNAEWKKIWFIRSSRIYLMLALIVSILIGLLFSLTTRVTQGREISELGAMEIISVNILGVDIVTIFLLLFVAMQIGREFQEKTIQSYLSVTPTRHQYFFFKVAVFTLIAFVVGAVVAIITLINGSFLVLTLQKTMPSADILLRFVLGSVAMPIFYSLLTACITFFTGNTATAITISLFVLFFPALSKIFPRMIQGLIIPVLPASAIHTLSGVAEKNGMEHTGVLVALSILVFWILMFGMLAILKFRKRDL